MARKQGRPTIFTKILGDSICKRIMGGESVRTICKDKDMPDAGTIYNWLLDKDASFFKQYARAKDTQAEQMFDELLEIADDGSNDYTEDEDGAMVVNYENIQRSRLRVDTRKWYLSKVLPKKFGDKLDLTSGGDKITPIYGGQSVVKLDEDGISKG